MAFGTLGWPRQGTAGKVCHVSSAFQLEPAASHCKVRQRGLEFCMYLLTVIFVINQ